MSGDPPALSRFELATRELRALGITLIRLYGEYCVNYRNGTDATAVCLSALAHAIALGRAMAVVASAEGTAVPVSAPRRMTPKAIISSRRMIRAHKRRMHALALEKKARIQGTLQTAYEFFNR